MDFISVSEVVEGGEVAGKWDLDLVHVVYSLSKDMGFPGFKLGIIYSYNNQVVNVSRKMSIFGLVSLQALHFIAGMLSNKEFVDGFIKENKKQLGTRRNEFTRGLAQVGIRCLRKGNAGPVLVDGLAEPSQGANIRGGDGSMELNEVKLNVSPGSSFHCSEPGRFRVCFANMDNGTMEVALSRIGKFVVQKKEAKTVRKLLAE